VNISSSWTCPVCSEKVPIQVEARSAATTRPALALSITVPDTVLADVFAHAWTHHEEHRP
jgi:hypothetical protein